MKLTKPFKLLNVNQCPKCHGKLMLVEEESYVAKLDKKGLPVGGQTCVEQRLVCSECGESYDAEKKGMCFQIAHTLPQIPVIVKDYNPFYQ